MSTTIVTIVISVISTLLIISLSLMTWVIVNLKRRVSKLEGLSLESANQFNEIYREFETVDRNHDQKIKQVESQVKIEVEGIYQTFKDVENGFEKKLDKRFENAYQKIKRLTEK
jgi:flagellar biosynthesis component FlhA